ncbi:GTP pyrophosphokinase [Ruegeria sp. MALMAid1280]|uniref:GTP pyrophosphokinase n=1 Tax=Ruegeria sp. MALMAid1280 TaxID=3411634 RepID=UPI003B9F2A30
MKSDEVKKIYQQNESKFEQLRTTVFGIIQNALKSGNLEHLPIESRVKKVDSCLEKIAKKKYSNPIEEMTDWVAFRVIVYLESDIKKASETLSDLFEIDVKNSIDKLTPDKVNEVGYRSYHLVCSLGSGRAQLPEYDGLSELKFEVQIRTVLQHAWAEIEHKRNYKGKSTLPQELQRRLMTAAGTLEILDKVFSDIAKDAELYAAEVEQENENVASDPINAIALIATYNKTLKKNGYHFKNINFGDEKLADKVVSELSRFGVNSITELQELINNNDAEALLRIHASLGKLPSAAGFFRHAMIISDPERYFREAFDNNFQRMKAETIDFLNALSKRDDIEQLATNAGVEIRDNREN